MEKGELPSLEQLGISSPTPKPASAHGGSLIGGESEGLARVAAFVQDACRRQGSGDCTRSPGRDFSSSMSPWLALGCVSPRRLFADMQAAIPVSPSLPASKSPCTARLSGSEFLLAELMWRDFFRFIALKYSRAPKQQPVSAQHGVALAPLAGAPSAAASLVPIPA
eukprot:jgi/Botrbrau1/15373/Bobra.43_2s0004.1